MTEGLYAELIDTNVNVTVVFPGGVGTDIMKNSGADNPTISDESETDTSKLLTPKEAAEIIISGMEKDQY